MVLKASSPELLIKKELILIKMLEHNRNFPLLISKMEQLELYRKKEQLLFPPNRKLDFLSLHLNQTFFIRLKII